MKKWLIAFGLVLLAFLPQIVFAEGIPGFSDSASTWFHFAPKSTDVSMKYLCSIFGTIEGVLNCPAQPESVFGSLFKVLNVGMLAIAGLVLIFTTVKTITETAADGSAMGQHTSHWLLLRVVIGNALLVPRSSGFSVVNAIVMWTVVQGVGFADMAWDRILDYLVKGHVIHVTSGSSSVLPNQGDVTKALAPDPAFVGGVDSDAPTTTDVFRSLVCMHALDRTFQDFVGNVVRNSHDKDLNSALAGFSMPLTWEFDETAKIVRFPKQPDQIMWGRLKKALSEYGAYDLSRFDNLAGVCGSYDWGTPRSISTYDYAVSADNYKNAKERGVGQMISLLDYPAQSLVNNVFDGVYILDPATGKFTNSAYLEDSLSSSFINALAQYFTVVNTVRSTFFIPHPQEGQSSLDSASSPIRADGWASAGKYFWSILKPPTLNIVSLQEIKSDPDFRNYGFGGASNAPVTFPIDYKSAATGSSRMASWNDLNTKLSTSLKNQKDENLKMADTRFVGDRTASIQNILSMVNNASDKALTKAKLLYAPQQPPSPDSFIGGVTPASGSLYRESGGITMQGFNLSATGEDLKKQALDMGIPGIYYSASGIGAAHGLPLAVKGWSRWIPGMLFSTMGDLVNKWNATMLDETLSPIEKTMKIGTDMVQAAQDFWTGLFNFFISITQILGVAITAMTAGSIAAIPLGFWGLGVNMGSFFAGMLGGVLSLVWGVVQTAFTIFLPATIGISLPLFVTGLTLSVYVPLIPFMLFTFGVVSWLIFVLETMAASPLIALGVTHPEGNAMLGKSEQALMMIVSVFLRPIMMIIGLTSGIVMSYVAIGILNYGAADLIPFIVGKKAAVSAWQAPTTGRLTDIYTMGESTYESVASAVHFDLSGYAESSPGVTTPKILMVMIIYTFTVLALINQCFSLIYRFPDEIMKYIGATGHQAGEAERMMGEIKGEAKEYGGAMGGMGRGMEGAGRLGEVGGMAGQTKAKEIGEAAKEKLKKLDDANKEKQDADVEDT